MVESLRAQLIQPNKEVSTAISREEDQFAQMRKRTAAVFKSTSDDFAVFTADPTIRNWLLIWQRSVTTLATNAVNSNLRITAEMFRLTNPAAFVESQHKFMNACRDAALQSGKLLHLATGGTHDGKPTALVRSVTGSSAPEKPDMHYVAEVMSQGTRVVSSKDTVQQVAVIMREENSGTIAVADNDRIVGIVTDHDIAVRMVAEARDPTATTVGEMMTPERRYVFEDVKVDVAAANMIEQQVSSLPVVCRKKRLVGMVSLIDLAPQERSTVLAARKMNGSSHKSTLHAQLAAGE